MSEDEDILQRLQARRAALEAEIRDVDVAITVVSRTLGTPAPEPSSAVQAPTAEGRPTMGGIPPDAFFRMSIADAAKKYLAMVKRKQSIQAIADALEQGGMAHTSKRFYGTVLTALRRQEAQVGDIVKVGRGIWGLAEWYPNRKRRAPVEDSKSLSLKPSDQEPE